MSGHQEQKNGDWFSWALIVFLFAVGIWPIALILLFFKLFGEDARKNRRQAPLMWMDQPVANPASHAGATFETVDKKAKNMAKRVMKSPAMRSSTARALKLIGVFLAAMGLYYAVDPANMVFSGNLQYWLWELLKYLGLAVGGLAMFSRGVSMDRAMKRYARYLVVIGNQEAVSFEQLSKTIGESEKRVVKDLQRMIEKGYFGSQAYLNLELGYLFRSSQASEDLERKQREPEQEEQPPKEAEEGYSGILRGIRRANDRIADPVLSEKISRLEDITAKIFKAVEEDPRKRSRIDTFLNYYLPTTQRLLDSYAEFEEAGVEGENLRQAKDRIRKTMDSIVDGFEHQLDELYKADAMDVDCDIRVMESMLNRDTASVEKDFGMNTKAAPSGTTDVGLGGVAAQQENEEK